ncbi:MAG: FAD-dependent oxidoreductase [Parasporobacterium sp.]|nr:FAD-dependent oxidoreductase [Parasporobacterium sp.]
MQKFAIIGMGCAGYHGVKSLREHGYEGEIHVFSDVSHPTANPMLTTYYVAGKIPRERMFPFGSLEEFTREFDVQVHADTKVLRVDTGSRCVVLEDGTREAFDKILIATGARAVSPALGQGGAGRTFLMRTVSDADQLKTMLEQNRVSSAVVVGASMVGIKVVELLYNRNVKVTMVDMASRLFPLACMQETAEILEQDLKDRGIDLLFRTGVDHVEETGEEVKTFLTDGTCLTSDILVLCIGTRANVELVANTQVIESEPVKVNRGIVVNTRMETNVPGIYAAGDCCEGTNLQTGETMIIGLWANAAAQGSCAGANMAGCVEEFPGSLPNNITHYFDKDFIGIGDPDLPGERNIFTNSHGMVSVIHEKDQLKCVNILGNYRISGMVKEYFVHRITGQGEDLTIADAGLLRASGVPEDFIVLLGGYHD